MARVVVCDDDAAVRGAVTAVCEDGGLEVVAETDSWIDATEMVRRFGVDIVVLDLSLADGSGEQTIEALRNEGSKAEIVVFTAFEVDAPRLLRMGARDVVDKTDFGLLSDILVKVARSIDALVEQDERRVASRAVPAPPSMWRSPGGVCSRHDLPHSLLDVEIGDAVLAVTVVGLEAIEKDVGPLLVADCRLAVAATLREELRVQDLLHEAPEIGGFIALLRGGDARSAGAVWSRLTGALRTTSLPGEVKGAASRIDARGIDDAVAKTLGALYDASVGMPAFVSV
jgi:CheY-like chemotaxis protein